MRNILGKQILSGADDTQTSFQNWVRRPLPTLCISPPFEKMFNLVKALLKLVSMHLIRSKKITISPLLPIDIVATAVSHCGHGQPARRYSGSTVATGKSHPSLLWSVAAMGTVTSSAHRYCGM
jgi:hypothetical protein